MRYTPDLHRYEVDDLLQPKKQEEIQEVVDKLKAFNPTKIALEVVKGKELLLNQEYQQYLNGEMILKEDEVHQFGFKLASELKHKRVYAVDWMESVGNRGLGEVYEWAKNEQPDFYQYLHNKSLSINQLNTVEKSIYQIICQINNEEFIKKGHEIYMAIARIGKEEEYVGIDWVRWWYQRNLIIYSNLANITTAPSDRTLLIIGGAHVHLISQFLRESGLFEVEAADKYFT